jgi:hypothetical protein
LNHRQPDQIPIDFGGSSVTGIHVSCVAELRNHFRLDKHPVKVTEPFQMLGEVEDDLRAALGVDVKSVGGRKTMFGFENKDWKPWLLNGLEVLVPGAFNVTEAENGDILIYPEGDVTAPPSGRMPKGFHFFDAIIRQNHFDPEHLDPAENLEEFGPIGEADLNNIAADVKAADTGEYALFASFGGTALGDIALVPAVNLRDPRGIRDVAEWYMSTSGQRDYIHKHPWPHWRLDRHTVPLRNRLRHAEFKLLLRLHLPRSMVAVLQADVRLDSWSHIVEDI